MRIPSPGFLFSAFMQVCRRFPAAILVSILGALACIGLVEEGIGLVDEDFLVRNWITCQLGLPFLTALVVFAESRDWNDQKKWLLQLLGLVALVACWYWLNPDARDFESKILPQYMALVLIVHLAVAFAPYLNSRSVRDFWDYNRQLFANFVVGAAFTLIIFAGLALALLAVDNLFDLNLSERLYAKLFILLAGVFNPSYFLYHFPKKYSAEEASEVAYSWVFQNLCKYILIPIVILYFLILYAYGAKVGLEWSLPKGWISSLIIGFSVAGIFTYLLNFYLEEEDNSLLVKGFKRWFWWVVLPLTGLLFIAIGKRISDYGITEERYLVVHLGVWLAAACLYFLFSKSDNIKFIPISLAIFALIWAFGPMSAFAVSERSQTKILTKILAQNGRLENGKMKPANTPMTEPERNQAISSIQYLQDRNTLTELLPQPIDSAWLEYGGIANWLKIELLPPNASKTLNISILDHQDPISIRGYDTAYPVDLYFNNNQQEDFSGMLFGISEDGKRLEWWQAKDGQRQIMEAYSLETLLQTFREKLSAEESNTYLSLSIQERTFVFSGKKANLSLVLETASMEYEEGKSKFQSGSGWILLKVK